jgi:hypothetical protein
MFVSENLSLIIKYLWILPEVLSPLREKIGE